MQTPSEALRGLLADVDACARAYADALVAYAQAEAAGQAPSTLPLLTCHDALNRAARALAAAD